MFWGKTNRQNPTKQKDFLSESQEKKQDPSVRQT